MFDKKNVLITGGAGFVGSNLIKSLLNSGANIRATLHKNNPQIVDEKIDYIVCDLTNENECNSVTKDMDYVFMCAANTSGAAVMDKTPLVHVTPNVIMNTLMLESAYRSGVQKFLFISTNTVYPVTNHPVKEDEWLDNPLFEKYFCVGWMKRFTELMCEMYATKIKKPMLAVVVRPGNIYGEYDDFEWETSHVIPSLIRKVVERHDPLEVWGDGNDIKDFIYIDDFIEGLLLAMDRIEEFQAINIASGHPRSIKEALNIMLAADGYTNARIVYNESKPTMIPKRLINVAKAKKLLKFEAKTLFATGVKRTIEWYKNKREIIS